MGIRPKRKLGRPVTLADIKADPAFAGWDFLRIGRLSVVPVPEPMWNRLLQLAESEPVEPRPVAAAAAAKPRKSAGRTKR